MLTAIWAQDKNGLIGKDGKLPWHIPEDLKHFKEQTEGKVVVMGRKTFEGMDSNPLPNRKNVVMTSDIQYSRDGVSVVNSLEEMLWKCLLLGSDTPIIIGGSSIYKQFLPHCSRLIRTIINHEFEGDSYFPEDSIDWSEWKLEERVRNNNDEYDFTFETFIKTQGGA